MLPLHSISAVLLTVLLIISSVRANWLQLATLPRLLPKQDVYSYKETALRKCRAIQGLELYQRRICEREAELVPTIAEAAKLAITECRIQFEKERWNCTDPIQLQARYDILGHTFRAANKETAFLQALTAMSMVYAITRDCHAGHLPECTCARTHNSMATFDNARKDFGFSGCNYNPRYAMYMTEQFLDPPQLSENTSQNALILMQLHNQRMGRTLPSENLKQHCRCHGVSGSCNMKTCWWGLNTVNSYAHFIKFRWSRAVLVTRKAKRKLRRRHRAERRSNSSRSPIRPEQLVYIRPSPTYCNRDNGILGTEASGRQCNRTSISHYTYSCQEMCCGRGFNTQMVTEVRDCECKFEFCCEVKCRTCTYNVELNTCK